MNIIQVIDLETTSLYPSIGHIVEVGLISVDLDDGTFNILFDEIIREPDLNVKQKGWRRQWVFKNTTLKPDEVIHGMRENQYRPILKHLLKKFPVTAWNNKFDYGFLDDREFDYRSLPCPMMEMYHHGYNGNHGGEGKWPSFQEAWDYIFPERKYVEQHRALDDAIHEGMVIHEMYKRGMYSW